MKILKNRMLIIGSLALVMLAASCKKDESSNSNVAFKAVIDGDGCKTHLFDGNKVAWNNGDVIKVFGGENSSATFTASGVTGNTQTVNFAGGKVEPNDYYRAFYPVSTNPGLNGELLTFTMPSTQYYADNNTFANSLSPMLAKDKANTGNTTTLHFHNLFGVLKIHFTSNTTATRAELTVPASSPAICGEFTVNCVDKTVTPATGNNNRTLTVDLGENFSLNDKYVYFVLPPGALANGFNISVYDGDKQLENKDAPGYSLGQNHIANAEMTVEKVFAFTVNSDGKEVVFSSGNLWYSNGKWYFEDEQYECHKSYANNTTSERGLFRWSSVNNPGGLEFKGYSSEFSDWGKVKIENDNHAAGTWYTLTMNEWKYLFDHHTKFIKTIDDHKCVVILPQGISGNSGDSWSSLKAKGALALPFGGAVYLESWGDDDNWRYNQHGWYWCSHVHPDNPNYGQHIFFDKDNFNINEGQSGDQKMLLSVRLVRNKIQTK